MGHLSSFKSSGRSGLETTVTQYTVSAATKQEDWIYKSEFGCGVAAYRRLITTSILLPIMSSSGTSSGFDVDKVLASLGLDDKIALLTGHVRYSIIHSLLILMIICSRGDGIQLLFQVKMSDRRR